MKLYLADTLEDGKVIIYAENLGRAVDLFYEKMPDSQLYSMEDITEETMIKVS